MAYIYYENGNSKHGEFEVMRESTAELFGYRPMAVIESKEKDAKLMNALVFDKDINQVNYTKKRIGLIG